MRRWERPGLRGPKILHLHIPCRYRDLLVYNRPKASTLRRIDAIDAETENTYKIIKLPFSNLLSFFLRLHSCNVRQNKMQTKFPDNIRVAGTAMSTTMSATAAPTAAFALE